MTTVWEKCSVARWVLSLYSRSCMISSAAPYCCCKCEESKQNQSPSVPNLANASAAARHGAQPGSPETYTVASVFLYSMRSLDGLSVSAKVTHTHLEVSAAAERAEHDFGQDAPSHQSLAADMRELQRGVVDHQQLQITEHLLLHR